MRNQHKKHSHQSHQSPLNSIFTTSAHPVFALVDEAAVLGLTTIDEAVVATDEVGLALVIDAVVSADEVGSAVIKTSLPVLSEKLRPIGKVVSPVTRAPAGVYVNNNDESVAIETGANCADASFPVKGPHVQARGVTIVELGPETWR